MLWKEELASLDARKRVLVAESGHVRDDVQMAARLVSHKLRWIESLSRVGTYLRPAVMMGAALVGYRRVWKRSRVVGALGAGMALTRGAWRLIRGRR